MPFLFSCLKTWILWTLSFQDTWNHHLTLPQRAEFSIQVLPSMTVLSTVPKGETARGPPSRGPSVSGSLSYVTPRMQALKPDHTLGTPGWTFKGRDAQAPSQSDQIESLGMESRYRWCLLMGNWVRGATTAWRPGKRGVVGWIVSPHSCPPRGYVEVWTLSTSLFGDKTFANVVKYR